MDLAGFQGSVQVQIRSSQLSEMHLKSVTLRGGSKYSKPLDVFVVSEHLIIFHTSNMNLLVTDASPHNLRTLPVLAKVSEYVDLPVLVQDIDFASVKINTINVLKQVFCKFHLTS